MPECCSHIATHLAEPYKSCFLHIYERMREKSGMVFGQVFQEELSACLKEVPLTEGDKKIFFTLFSDSENGYGDKSMQIRAIEQNKELLQHVISRLEQENTEKCRMAVGLGVMSGLLLLVILI